MVVTKKIGVNIVLIIIFGMAFACSQKKEISDCPPVEPIVKKTSETVVMNIFPPKIKHKADADHCQVCVQSPSNFISCQRVWGDNGETRNHIKDKAIKKACKDAGFPNTCPKSAIQSIYCKNDSLTENATNGGMALQKIHLMSKQRAQETNNTKNKTKNFASDEKLDNKSILIK